jgi:hypothetical protein
MADQPSRPVDTLPTNPVQSRSASTLNGRITSDDAQAVSASAFQPSQTAGSRPSSEDLGNQTGQQPDQDSISVRPNALSKFSSHNYIVKFQATDTNGLNRLLEQKQYINTDWYTIIDSAGGSRDPKLKDQNWFSAEYYIDNIEFETIPGINHRTRSTIECSLKFTVTEPYGMGFLKELWFFNTEVLKSNNYLDTCYILTIDWKGFTDSGELIQLPQTKYIPFRITNIEIQLQSSGSTYTIEAVPYNYLGNTQIYGFIPNGVTATGVTLKELTQSLATNINKSLTQSAKENYAKTSSIDPEPMVTYNFEFDQVPLGNETIDIGSYELSTADEINTINKPLTGLGPEIHKDLASSLSSFSVLNTAIPKGQSVPFNGREQIAEALAQMVINSKYITDQIRKFKEKYNNIVSTTSNTKQRIERIKQELNEPVKWFKIVPEVSNVGKWNDHANMYTKTITYRITPYIVTDSRNSNNFIGKQALQPADLSKDIVKEYFYFFTGKNTEIINCDIKFNTMYFNFSQSNLSKINQASGTKPFNPYIDPPVQPQDKAVNTDPGTGAAVSSVPITPIKQNSSVGKTTPERSKAAEFSSILFSPVDLLSVELEILGDPDLIMQDTVIYPISKTPEATDSIVMNAEEKFFRLKFVSPADIDLATGLIKRDPADNEIFQGTTFDGIYRLITVNSQFKQGKFTQNLQLVKVVMANPVVPAEERTEDQSYSQEQFNFIDKQGDIDYISQGLRNSQ